MRMRHIVCHAPLYNIFSTLSYNRYDFRKKKKLLNTKCMFRFPPQLLSETFLILRRIKLDTIRNECWASHKVYVILIRFERNFNFLYRYLKNTEISNITKIRPVGAELFHADNRTDKHDEANSRFAQFCKRS